MTVGNNQLPKVALHTATHEWVRSEVIHRGLNRRDSGQCGIRVLIPQELQRTFDMVHGAR